MVSAKEKFLSNDNFGAEHEKQDEEGKKRRKLFRSAKEKQGWQPGYKLEININISSVFSCLQLGCL